jgi:hypothetical protein
MPSNTAATRTTTTTTSLMMRMTTINASLPNRSTKSLNF